MFKGEGDFAEYLGENDSLLPLRRNDEDGEKEKGAESESSSSDSSDEDIRQDRPRRRYRGPAIHGSGSYTYNDNRAVNLVMQAPAPVPVVQALQTQIAQVQLQSAQVELQQQQTVLQQQQIKFYLEVGGTLFSMGLAGLTIYKNYKNNNELEKAITHVLSTTSNEQLEKFEKNEPNTKVRWIYREFQSKLKNIDTNDTEARAKLSQETASKLMNYATVLSKTAEKPNSWCLTM